MEVADLKRARISLLSLGGTIAMTGEKGERVVPTLASESLLAGLPEVGEIADVDTDPVRQVPGAHLVQDDLLELANVIQSRFEAGGDGVVVTQGTDTLEESAFALDSILVGDGPVVVTGALRNPSMVGSDGPANLLAAIRTAASPQARGSGVLVVMNDEIHSARFVRKVHTSNPAAFGSPLTGPIGWVTEGMVRIVTLPARSPSIGIPHGDRERPVALLRLWLGDDGRLVRMVPDMGYEGLVVEGFGGGHVPATLAETLGELTSEMPVVLASRTGTGEILERTYGFTGSETDLLERGLISAGYLDGLKARILLSLLLRSGMTRDDVPAAFRIRSTASLSME
jgi:L-asparaginase